MGQIRKTNTKSYLKQALTQLLANEKLEEISISKLTKKAGINRGTFYAHYLDKNDLMEQLKNETLQELMLVFNEGLDVRSNIERALVYIEQEFDFIYAIRRSRAIDFQTTVKEFLKQILASIPHSTETLEAIYQVPNPYALEIFLNACSAVTITWIDTGGKESPKLMTEILLAVSHLEDITLCEEKL